MGFTKARHLNNIDILYDGDGNHSTRPPLEGRDGTLCWIMLMLLGNL